MLMNYRKPSGGNNRHRNSSATPAGSSSTSADANPTGTEMSFLQTNTVAGTDGVTHEGIKCYNFQNMGHYANQCPEDLVPTEDVQALQLEGGG